MHTHGHYQQIIARDAAPVDYHDVEDTVLVAPGQRVDVVVDAERKAGNVADPLSRDGSHRRRKRHAERADHRNPLRRDAQHADRDVPRDDAGRRRDTRALSFWTTVLLGAIAGFTIFLGLADRARAPAFAANRRAAQRACDRHSSLSRRRDRAKRDRADLARAHRLARRCRRLSRCAGRRLRRWTADRFGRPRQRGDALHARKRRCMPRIRSCSRRVIAIGIGAHNFGEGLAIGASAASGATAVALALIVGFGLHNATEGFGVAAPLVGRVVPTWAQIGLAGLIAGGPTFVGTIIGYSFYSPTLSVLLPRDRGRRARLRHRRALERPAAHGAYRIRHRNDVRGLPDRARDRTLSRHERRLASSPSQMVCAPAAAKSSQPLRHEYEVCR